MLFLRRENPGVIHVGCDIHVMWVSPGPVDTAPTRFCRAPNTSRSLAACVVPSAHLQVAAGQLRGPGTGGPGAAPARRPRGGAELLPSGALSPSNDSPCVTFR